MTGYTTDGWQSTMAGGGDLPVFETLYRFDDGFMVTAIVSPVSGFWILREGGQNIGRHDNWGDVCDHADIHFADLKAERAKRLSEQAGKK